MKLDPIIGSTETYSPTQVCVFSMELQRSSAAVTSCKMKMLIEGSLMQCDGMFLAPSSKRLPCSDPPRWRPAGGGTPHMLAHCVSLIRQPQTGGCYSTAWHQLQVSMEHNLYSQTHSQARRHFLFHLGQTGRNCQAAENTQSPDPHFDCTLLWLGESSVPKNHSCYTCTLVAVAPHIHLVGTSNTGWVKSQLLDF